MGVATSTTKKVREEQQMLHPHEHLDKDDEVVVRLMLPIYYTTAEVTTVEYEIVSNCWTLILTNAAPGFLSLRKDPNFKFPTSISFFYKIFYSRLFDIHPGCRDLFKDVNTQGKFLVKMITLSLSEKKDPEKYEDTLRKLAQVHNERGVKAVECKGLPIIGWLDVR